MTKIFFGKFNRQYPEQFEDKFYAAGEQNSSWYGGIKPGDIVFPIYSSKISEIWKVREYTNFENRINEDGVVTFDLLIKLNKPISIQQFIKYPYFNFDLNLLNKVTKATKGCGFFEIQLTDDAPKEITMFDFTKERRVYISYEKTNNFEPKEKDINVKLNSSNEIISIDVFQNSDWQVDEPLQSLYNSKNPKKYSLDELLIFALDEAKNKAKYLKIVLEDLKGKRCFIVDHPVHLYDNILVGRRKTPRKGESNNKNEVPNESENESESIMDEIMADYHKYAKILEFNPNIILYGPPGTGKTFTTKRIIESFEMKNEGHYEPYENIEKEKRVQFVTFHQSYSYEEFIEGIRPNLDDENGELSYKIDDGIFKTFVQAASTQFYKNEIQMEQLKLIQSSSRVWKVSLGRRNEDEIYDFCKKNKHISVGFLYGKDLTEKDYDEIYNHLSLERDTDDENPKQNASSLNNIVNEMLIGDLVLIYDGPETIRDIGIITTDYEYKETYDYQHTRKVVWLKEFEEPHNIHEMNGQKRLTLKSVYELPRITVSDILEILSEDVDELITTNGKSKPYYFIIDEINRGNISKIFGELITLIEKDKRNEIKTILPYSKKPFTIPENVYIIGTMNTADRSIALLDTALRRRFAFIELEPDPNIFTKDYLELSVKVNDSILLDQLLIHLNEGIQEHLGRDYRIGHAYFMGIISIEDLYNTWYYKILPLLMEYFYQEYKTINQVIGNSFITEQGVVQYLSIDEFEQAIIQLIEG
ncbi:AAA family ATPase [Viridibacillus sp. NPDC093762]|uniref:AAA family ATPase n=1 Tax=Viridibacillus sp. NPDC093762 TaxID=3390720 RepID=UPI003D02C155